MNETTQLRDVLRDALDRLLTALGTIENGVTITTEGLLSAAAMTERRHRERPVDPTGTMILEMLSARERRAEDSYQAMRQLHTADNPTDDQERLYAIAEAEYGEARAATEEARRIIAAHA